MAAGYLSPHACPRCGWPMRPPEGWNEHMRALVVNGEPIKFTEQQWAILEMLRKAMPERVHPERMIVKLWGSYADPPQSNVLKSQLSYIRKKLAPTGFRIRSTYGEGWAMTWTPPGRARP